MAKTKLTWEDIIQYEEIKGYGQHVWRHQGQYYLVVEEGGIATQRVVYELPTELYQLLESGERDLGDLHTKLRYGRWPSTEEEKKNARKKFLIEHPIALIANPSSREFFTHEELEELIPIGEKLWIESEGKLPDDYVSPIE